MNSTVSFSFSFLKSVATKKDVRIRMDEREKEELESVCLHSLFPFCSVESSVGLGRISNIR